MTDLRKTAVYIRLSAEDDNVDGRAKKESDSVTSQRILLKSFVIDELGVVESDILEYVDDGVSGTHFKRQGFQQLQDDMKSGEIGCVVVKDFSRFGRDYLEVGFYIEYIFPLLQIRFISINDSYDSAASSGMTGGMNVALQNLVYNMYSLDLSKKISSALQTRTRNGTRLPVNARYGYKKGKDGRLEVDPEAAKVVKMIFQMAAEGTSFADITRELNRQAIATCDEQKLSRGDQVQFQRFDTIKKKHWSPTTVAAIVRDEIYIGTRIWGKTRCSMHTGHKAVLNDETEWVRLENHHTAIIDRELFEKANEMHPKKKRSVAESRTNFTLERRKKQPALLICANCGHSLLILISCGARLAPFDIKELRDLMETDEMELDTIGDRKTALFVIISDTDDTFNFVVSILYTQLFNLLCDKADDEYGGRLPVHVRCLLDEFANIGQIPKFEKLIATIRSREISASIILQSQSQLKAIYKDNADTIAGNCDTTLFLGGKEKTTLKEMSEILGKETIDSFNTSENRGREVSHGLNYQKLGKQLMTEDEIAVMDGGKCILQLRGVRPFFSNKYDITKHPNYKYLSDYDKKNTFDMEKHLRRRPALVKPDELFDYYEISESDLQEDTAHE